MKALIEAIDDIWSDGATPGWLEQTDGEAGHRVLLGTAMDMDFLGKRLRAFKIHMSGHQASPIYYVFVPKGSGDECTKTAHYILSHQRSSTWREWFCDTTQRSVPHLGTYPGDLSMVGSRFRPICTA